jgi:hypothetical protein
MLRRRVLRDFGLLTILVTTGCSSDSKSSGNEIPNKGRDAGGSGGAGSEGDARGAIPAPDAFNGDCKTAKWANLSDECWACMCGACEPTLNLCKEGCTAIFECAQKEHTLVNVGADIGCEVRATGATCIQDPTSQAETPQLLNLDGCLIGAKKEAGEFRVCDTVCKTPYTGDVCQRFPPTPPPAM